MNSQVLINRMDEKQGGKKKTTETKSKTTKPKVPFIHSVCSLLANNANALWAVLTTCVFLYALLSTKTLDNI